MVGEEVGSAPCKMASASSSSAHGGEEGRLEPNILITGTPGTGKSTLGAEAVVSVASAAMWR
jgi:Cdc6-like AAA superfamily ATPase